MSASGGQLWEEWKDWILEYEVGQNVAEMVQQAGSKLRSSYSYVGPEDKIDNILTWLRQFLSSYDPTTEAGWNRYLPRVKKNDPETGQYEVDIPLPMKAHSLEHLVSHVHPDNLRHVGDTLQARFNSLISQSGDASLRSQATTGQQQTSSDNNSLGYSVWDTVYQYKPASWKPLKWAPPYESTAYLIGGHHFVTFDGHVYDFMANCEYLLARDFHDAKFTITAAFKRSSGGSTSAELDSLKIHTNDHLIEIPRDGVVKVDNRAVELPWHKMDTMEGLVFVKVVDKNYAVKLKTHDGLKVKCTRQFYMCSITLPGHYHAKSAGLLGSNDNEPSNDMLSSDGIMSNSVDEFASSWHIGGGRCTEQRNLAPSVRPEANSQQYSLCREKFMDSGSPFRSCFRQVKPGPYMAMCTVDMVSFGLDAWCNISAAYIAACSRQGVPLSLPSECVKCSAPSSSAMTESDSVRISGRYIPNSADVVFAVEERPCMRWSKGKIPEFARLLQGELGKKRITNIRYGVVGYYELQTRLLEGGLMLHLITDKGIELDSGPSGDFIGLDANSLFTASGSNTEQRENLVEPHDSCTVLAQESNGTVFTGQKQNVIVQRMTEEIGKKVLPMTCQLCECQVVKLSPVTVCYPCDVPRPVSLTNADNFLNIPYLKLKKSYDRAQQTFAQMVV